MLSFLIKVVLFILLFYNDYIFLTLSNELIDFNKNKKMNNIVSDTNEEFKDIQKFVNIVFNETLIDEGKIFYRSNNPKISVIITIYNGEAYLKKALLSVQNQDFKDIEIIMIDDA